ncbi:hypothetical protein NX772_03425 [Mesomycoplasma molare]|uniref:Uncharacterized protein n=1 Tax=Mesomycoplasma molare TaxID=171288 RepID=A0ABY5TTX8_9BACT|nr:hypothetical protein [Mesomycoplasma molare]UWD34113.1 hypothetical protein NX772_03425 [Mesomycoplasma molare]
MTIILNVTLLEPLPELLSLAIVLMKNSGLKKIIKLNKKVNKKETKYLTLNTSLASLCFFAPKNCPNKDIPIALKLIKIPPIIPVNALAKFKDETPPWIPVTMKLSIKPFKDTRNPDKTIGIAFLE